MKTIILIFLLLPTIALSADQYKIIHGENSGQACTINFQGKLFCWGTDPLITDMNLYQSYKDVYLATAYGCVISTEGTVKCMGKIPGNAGTNPVEEFKFNSPITEVTTADDYFCFLVKGKVHCRGMSGPGKFIQQDFPFDVTKIILVNYKTCAIVTTGSVYCWDNKESKTPVKLPLNEKIKDSGSAALIFCGLSTIGQVVCWDFENKSSFTVKNLPLDVESFSSSNGYPLYWKVHERCAISKGNVYCWSGVKAKKVEGVENAVQVEVSRTEACASLKDGTIKCWREFEKPRTFVPPSSTPVKEELHVED